MEQLPNHPEIECAMRTGHPSWEQDEPEEEAEEHYEMTDSDICYECGGLGDDFSIGENGEGETK